MAARDSSQPFNVYLEEARTEWLDSMEGVPVVDERRAALPGEKFLAFGWQRTMHRGFDGLGALAPGLALAVVLAWAGTMGAGWLGRSVLGFEKSPLSPVLVTVLVGLVVRNLIGLPAVYEDGLRFCVKRVLRIGVALLGLRLSLAAVGQIGLSALPVILFCIAAGLVAGIGLSRACGMSPRLGALIAVGTSICGVSAIVATAPAIDAEKDEVGYAVAVITLFGMLGLFFYPFLSHWMFAGDVASAGIFLGTAIHDTSQVAGAGLMYEARYAAPEALDVAATTKLVRNLCMGAVIPLMAILQARRVGQRGAGRSARRMKVGEWLPLFVVGFVVLAGLRSAGDLGERAFGFLEREAWEGLIAGATKVSIFCLSVAMAAVGLGTSVLQFRRLGWKPLAVGFAAAVIVGGVSAGGIFAMRAVL